MTETASAELGLGRSGIEAGRADGIPKVTGEFAFSSDLQAAGMLWGHTLRSPHAHARTNASFTDYLIPTALDVPSIVSELIEEPEPDAPYGAKGAGEPPMVVAPAAVVSALRDATGRELPRIPVHPDDLVGL